MSKDGHGLWPHFTAILLMHSLLVSAFAYILCIEADISTGLTVAAMGTCNQQDIDWPVISVSRKVDLATQVPGMSDGSQVEKNCSIKEKCGRRGTSQQDWTGVKCQQITSCSLSGMN